MNAVQVTRPTAVTPTTSDRIEPFASALDVRTQAIDARLHAQALRRVSATLRAQRQLLRPQSDDHAGPTGLSSLVVVCRSTTDGAAR